MPCEIFQAARGLDQRVSERSQSRWLPVQCRWRNAERSSEPVQAVCDRLQQR
ncbi:MAG: hypothetical protein ACYDCL_04350 [Myxococcales bacterium]